jgi:hypothetical protein
MAAMMTARTNRDFSGWRRLAVEALVMMALWVAAITDLLLHLSRMKFLSAFFLGSMVFVIPFYLWRDLPKVMDGWKARNER